MATKPLPTSVPDLHEYIKQKLSFDERVELLELQKTNVSMEAKALKETGEKAAKVLESINTNGK